MCGNVAGNKNCRHCRSDRNGEPVQDRGEPVQDRGEPQQDRKQYHREGAHCRSRASPSKEVGGAKDGARVPPPKAMPPKGTVGQVLQAQPKANPVPPAVEDGRIRARDGTGINADHPRGEDNAKAQELERVKNAYT